ncbi:transcription termination factor MTERF15, mitochondrial-like [Tripterygium wilfordii]|nr:transcription termination factor MTERF15, mitochondrial-like [Tripterygium wilfordii]
MFSFQWTKRYLQLLVVPLRDSTTHLRLLHSREPLTIMKSFSSMINEASIAGQEEKELPFTVSYLVNSFGFSSDTAVSLSNRVNFETTEKPDAVLEFLRDQGFTIAQISRFVKLSPRLLVANPKKTLLPKIEFFRSVGILGDDLVDVTWRIMWLSLKNQIIPTYKFLKNFLKDDEKVLIVLKRAAFLHNFPKLIAPNISRLQQLGVPQSSISVMLTRNPTVLRQKAERFDECIKMITEMGFDPLQIKFVVALRVVSTLRRELWEHRLKVYREWGWSESEILLAFRLHPLFMTLSEVNITRKLDFLVNKLGWASAAVAKASYVLTYNMEKRMIPRCSVIQALIFKR